jgi:hypothetical protein
MKVWVEKAWRKRKQSFFYPKSLLIMDSCRAHITDDTKQLVSKYYKLAIIPGRFNKKKSSHWIYLLINLLNQSCVLLGRGG